MLGVLLPFLMSFSPSGSQAELPRKEGSTPAAEAKAAPAEAASAKEAGEGKVLAVYEPYGIMPDAPAAFDFSLFSFDEPVPTSLFDLCRAFEAVKSDDSVPVVVFDPKDADIGISQVQTLRREFKALRDAGKEVWVYLDTLDLGSLLLASEASMVVLMPEADVLLQGFYIEDYYFKTLLDKVGVQADIIHIGDFKSAGEPFTRTSPSDEARKQNEALFDSLYQQMLNQVCQSRKVERAKLDALIDKGYVKPSDLVDLGLVDVLSYRTDFVKQARAKVGKKAEVVYDYGMSDESDKPKLNLNFGLGDLFKLGGGGGHKPPSSGKKAVAVVVFEGTVDASTVTPVRREILKAAKSKSVRALVLRVNSPGGSALESEILWEATDRFRAAKKPLIVSMGDVAASGGYYMAAGADAIFAEAGTITGSIGVVGGKIVMKGLLDWAGIHTHAYQRGKHASSLSSTEVFSAEQRALVTQSMEDVYKVFKKRVQDGRGDALQGDLEPMAGGRVYTGEQALKLGLVDRIGGLNEAIAYAAEQAKVDDYEVRLMPEPRSITQYIEELLGQGADPADDFIRLEAGPRRAPGGALLKSAILQPIFSTLSLLDARAAAAVRGFLRQAECLRNEGVLLAAPPRSPRFR